MYFLKWFQNYSSNREIFSRNIHLLKQRLDNSGKRYGNIRFSAIDYVEKTL